MEDLIKSLSSSLFDFMSYVDELQGRYVFVDIREP